MEVFNLKNVFFQAKHKADYSKKEERERVEDFSAWKSNSWEMTRA
jgi:hypothetical protein